MIHSRRFALIAAVPALVVMTLSACGEGSRDGVLGQSSPAVIHIGASNGSGGSKVAAESTGVGDMAMWAPWVQYSYSFSGDASSLPTTGAAWSFATGGSPDAQRLAAIAASFGLAGELQPLPADYGGGWVIGSTDYTGPSLMVGTDGMLSWWYNVGPTEGDRMWEGCAESESVIAPDAGGGTDAAGSTSAGSAGSTETTTVESTLAPVPCVVEEPTPPANVPDKTAAENLFRGLVTEWGYDAASVTLETYADEWGAYVTGFLSLGGFRSPASVTAGFGADGAITWASGTLADAAPAGEYPLVSVDEAIARLNDRTGKWGWFGGWNGYAKGGIALDYVAADAATGAATEGPGVAIDPAIACTPGDDSCGEFLPYDTVPSEPQEVAVAFTSVTMEMTTVWAEDGTIYVLPAYSFAAADGTTAMMVAVGEEYLDLPEITTTDTMPVTTVTGDTAVVSTEVVTPDTSLVHPTPVTLPEDVVFALAEQELVGLTLEEATKVAEGLGLSVRVCILDGVAQALTEDYNEGRVNLSVEAGVVSGIDFIG